MDIFNDLKTSQNLDLKTKKICCFTGHRPQKLPWRFDEKDYRCINLKLKMKHIIETAINDGYSAFLTGMALGFDIMCAEIILELKVKHTDIELFCVLPCKNQCRFWSDINKKKYLNVLANADGIRCIFQNYNKFCMMERNKYMVDNSTLIFALFNGASGGTGNTLEYAKKQNKKIIIINP